MLEKDYSDAVTIGKVERHKNLAVAPVYAPDSFLEEILMLDRALETGNFTITGSSVNEMVVDNKLDEGVLVVGGSTIEGDGQKRYAKFPTLVLPQSQIILPVNCAERAQSYIRGSYGMNTTIVMPSMRAGDVQQDDAWRQIANTTVFLNRMNPTLFANPRGSYINNVDRNANIEDYLDAIGREPRDGQVGIIAGIRDGERTIYYTDFFGKHQILNDVYAKLAKCFGIVARVHEGDADNVTADDLAGFFRKFEVAESHRESHVGGGKLYLLRNQEDGAVLTGTVLAYEDAPVQVTMREKVGQD